MRAAVTVGSVVSIVQKAHQASGERTEGVVLRLLTRSEHHPRGIKVELTSGVVGRVQELGAAGAADGAADGSGSGAGT